MPPTPLEGSESSTGSRRLHVIVISDVVNSTARMFLDEASTVAQIEFDLQGFDLLIEQQGGRLIKHSGDGVLATFATTSSALAFIEAAVLHLHRRGGSPLQHRFGMHLCESYQTGTDILGKGVNLASRLQTISPANGVAFSADTFNNLDADVRRRTIDLGWRTLKGLQGRIHCFGIEEHALLPAAGRAALTRRLPVRRRDLLHRLATSQHRQLYAALAVLLLGLYSDLDPPNPLSSWLLDRRLHAQRSWRELTSQPGPYPPAIPVVLIPSGEPMMARDRLAGLITALPPQRFPVVALDYVFHQTGAAEAATARLAALIQQQRRPQLLLGWFDGKTPKATVGRQTLVDGPLTRAGAQLRNLTLGTAGRESTSGRQPSPLRLLEAITPKTFAGSVAQVLNPAAKRMPSEAVIDWSVAWDRGMTSTLLTGSTDDRDVLSSLPTSPLLVIGSLNNRDERDADLFHTPAAFLRAEPVWGGATAAMPGVIAQVVLAQSLATGHWLTPLSDVACVALAAGLGIMTAALLPGRGQRLRLLGIGLPLAGLAGLQVAVGAGILIPLALPSVAFASSCLLRRES